jgi:hypothetical protein
VLLTFLLILYIINRRRRSRIAAQRAANALSADTAARRRLGLGSPFCAPTRREYLSHYGKTVSVTSLGSVTNTSPNNVPERIIRERGGRWPSCWPSTSMSPSSRPPILQVSECDGNGKALFSLSARLLNRGVQNYI